ncbi:MAG: FecR family protein [Sediminibacterium sp.]|nr:FecR family protein [Sediminibacterium sp.]
MGTFLFHAVYIPEGIPTMEERFIYLVKQQLSKRISKAESGELQELLFAHDELQKAYEAIFSVTGLDTEEDLLESEQSYAAHAVRMHLDGAFETDKKQQPSTSFRPIITRKKYWIPAAFILIILIAAQLYFPLPWSRDKSTLKNQVGTKKGSKSHILLPDGTNVWLNADSRIIYPANFEGETREVSLVGEAFFDVVKNAKRPFIIHTGAMDVKVLGTAFNVRSYPGELTTEAALLRGSIEVTLNDKEKKKILLKPNEKLTVLNSDESYQKTGSVINKKIVQENEEIPILTITKIHYNEKDSSNAETSWVNNKLSFDNEKIDRVFSKIEQWYNIEIVMEDENIQSKHFTATFENKSLKDVMEALALALNFKYQEKNGKIIIR